MTSSSSFHFPYAALTNALAAASGAPLSKYGTTICATYSLLKNSHTPSLAMTIILSLSYNTISPSSGSHETPTEWATLSPRLRDMASPGISSLGSQTRWGPTAAPVAESVKAFIRPEREVMRRRSSSRSGLWSRESWCTCGCLCQVVEIRMERESPAFAMYSLLPYIYIVLHVVPL